MLQLRCDGDYRLLADWLAQHRSATIVYDTASGLPTEAVYPCPLYEAYVVTPRVFLEELQHYEELEDGGVLPC